MGNEVVLDLMQHDGLTCSFGNVQMAQYGSKSAKEYRISRADQDKWALRSHLRAVHALDKGSWDEEVVPVRILGSNGVEVVVTVDEAPRKDANMEALTKLTPLFAKDGTITAGNAPGVNDGAGAFVLMSEEKAKELGKVPLATILGHAEVGLAAQHIATASGFAIQKLLSKTGYSVQDITLFEINEAFASVVLISSQIVGLDPERVNVNGGAIALGHPIGASGARIVMTLIYELRRRGGGLGIAAICSGAAQGDAILVSVDG